MDTAGRAAGLKTVYFGQQGHLLAGTSLESASIDVHRLRHYPHVSNTHVEAFRSGLGHFRVLLQQKVGTDPHYRFPGPPSEPLHGRATHLYHRVLDVLENRLLAKPRNDTPRARLSPFSKRELLDLEERLLDQRFLSWSVSGHSVGAYLEPAFEFDSHNVLEVIHVFPNGGAEEASAHLEHNKGGWHVRQGALGEVALDRYLLQDGRRLLVISTIQPGAGYRELRKSLRHRLDPWREETIIRIAEVGSAMGYLVAATSAEARLRTNPNMNDFEIRTNYVDPFKGAMWADTLFSFNHPAEESSDPLPLKVYQDERISTFPASKRRPGHYGISRILYRSS